MTRQWPNNRYRRIWVDGKQCYEHRVVWERAHGPIPPGFHVHHIDEDPTNNDLANLECVAKGTHTRIHHPAKPRVVCAEPGCTKYTKSRGYCAAHYVRYFRREKLNAYSLEYSRRRRAARTPEQREAELQKQREYDRRKDNSDPARFRRP